MAKHAHASHTHGSHAHGSDEYQDAADQFHDTHEGSHVVYVKTYLMVFAALMVLLVLTLVVAMFDVGPLNIIVAMTVAIIKAVLVILYFMHVRFSSRLIWLFAGAGFLWLIILFAMTLGDYFSRDMLPWPGSWLPRF